MQDKRYLGKEENSMSTKRIYLEKGTRVSLSYGNTYEITGEPIGNGGGSVVYPAEKIYESNGETIRDGIRYAIKECYPVSLEHSFVRNEQGEIVPEKEESSESFYLDRVKEMQLREKEVTQQIYRTGSRLLPILESSKTAVIQKNMQNVSNGNDKKEQSVYEVNNAYTVMESLASKGKSLHSYIEEYGSLTPAQTFHVIRQLLFSLREIHNSGFLHLDIQDGNVFLKGTLEDESDILTLIDFGSARELSQGKTEVIADRVIFTTQGFSAPEILLHNDGTLQLGPEADIYSVGCLILYLLTGNCFDANYLMHNKTGKYLTNFKLRKIACPKHLIDRMQEIIARALEIEPQNRYQSADEMLTDVTDFVKALQPYRSDLASVSYDAFICYKHGEIDSAAARTLQNELEHFRAPHRISEKRNPFKRVFLDEGELSSCADFGEQVRVALQNSGWLIVVCSPETPLSPWVKLEIETFLKYHDRSRILAVLTDGDPEKSFPQQLLGENEVLAADARGNSKNEVVRKLKGDALLKIVAPMLGITYDSLKQRQKTYRYQRIAAAATFFMVLAVMFSGYAYRQAAIISNQEKKISEEYTRNLISQSEYYVKEAAEKMADENIIGAMENLVMALPDEMNDRPVVPGAVYMLNDILNTYKSDYDVENAVSPVDYLGVTNSLMKEKCYFDPSGKYFFTADNDTIWVRRLDDFEVVQSFASKEDNARSLTDFFNDFLVKDEQQIIYCRGGGEIYCRNYLSGEEVWSVTVLDEEEAFSSEVSMILSEDKNLLFAVVQNTVYIINSNTGKVTDKVAYLVQGDLEIKELSDPSKYQEPELGDEIAVSTDNRYLAFTTHQYDIIEPLRERDLHKVYIVDFEKHTVDVMEEGILSVREMIIYGNNLLLQGNTAQAILGDNQKHCYVGETEVFNYNISEGRMNWNVAYESTRGNLNEHLNIKESPYDFFDGKVIFAISYDSVIVLSYEDGHLIQNIQYSSPIVSAEFEEDAIHAVHENGNFSWKDYNINVKIEQDQSAITYQKVVASNIVDIQRIGDFFYVAKKDDSDSGLRSQHPLSIIKYQLQKAGSGYQKLLEKPYGMADKMDNPAKDGWVYKIDNNRLYLTDCKRAMSYEVEIPPYKGNYIDEFWNHEFLGVSGNQKQAYLFCSNFDDKCMCIGVVEIEKESILWKEIPINENEIFQSEVCFYNDTVYYFTKEQTVTNYRSQVSEGKDGKAEDAAIYDVGSYNKINVYEWSLNGKNVLLKQIKLEEAEEEVHFTSDDYSMDYGKCKIMWPIEDYLWESFVIDDSGQILSLILSSNVENKDCRVININISNKNSQSICLDLSSELGDGVGLDRHVVNEKYKMNGIISHKYDGDCIIAQMVLFDFNGKKVCSFSREGEEIAQIFFSKNNRLCWVLYRGNYSSGEQKLEAYDIGSGAVCTTINLWEYGDYWTFMYDCQVQWMNENRFLLYDGGSGFIIEENSSSIGVAAYINNCIGYSKEKEKIYTKQKVSGEDKIEFGSFSYVPVDDLVKQAKDILDS